MHRVLAVVALLTLAVTSAPVGAKCMQLELKAQVLTASVEITGDGGGIVVATTGTGIDDKGELPANQTSWKLRVGKTLADPPVITTLAPGLVLYSPPPSAKGNGDLVTRKGKVLARWKRTTAKRAALDAPVIKAIKHTADIHLPMSEDTLVELDGKVPATAIAMILVDNKGTALTWGVANPGVPAVRVYSHGHCDVSNGTLPPSLGDSVTLAWVDKHGRVSPASKPISVIKAE